MFFLQPLFQHVILAELYAWVVLTGWSALLLIFAVISFFLLGISHTRKAWWQYTGLLLMGALGLWSLSVAYNGYQHWLSFNAQLPAHGLNTAFNRMRTPYLIAIQNCQFQFVLVMSLLMLLLCLAGWQIRGALFRRNTPDRLAGSQHIRVWANSIVFLIGLCCLGLSVFLLTKLFLPLVYAPQDFQFVEPTVLELIGLFVALLAGPFILLLVSTSNYVNRRIIVAGEGMTL